MRPLQLSGHERGLTQLKYSREGDLLFSGANDKFASVWLAANGERIGTYSEVDEKSSDTRSRGGNFASIDVDWMTESLISGSGNFTVCIWDCETGQKKFKWDYGVPIRSVGWSYSGNLFAVAMHGRSQQDPRITVHDKRDPDTLGSDRYVKSFDIIDSSGRGQMKSAKGKIVWGALDDIIYCGMDTGSVGMYSVKSGGEMLITNAGHKKEITDIQVKADYSLLITSSKDMTAILYNGRTLEPLNQYKTERPVNSAAISPSRNHVLLGGGTEAIDAATTGDKGGFEGRLFHMVFATEFAKVHGHFGPINTVAFAPDGLGYASGGEDGYIRLHTFDDDYVNYVIQGDDDDMSLLE